jgi:hypothetical protein
MSSSSVLCADWGHRRVSLHDGPAAGRGDGTSSTPSGGRRRGGVQPTGPMLQSILGSAEPTGSPPSDHEHIYRQIRVVAGRHRAGGRKRAPPVATRVGVHAARHFGSAGSVLADLHARSDRGLPKLSTVERVLVFAAFEVNSDPGHTVNVVRSRVEDARHDALHAPDAERGRRGDQASRSALAGEPFRNFVATAWQQRPVVGKSRVK